MLESVTVKVPATTANMGPGFDCLGMALDIWNKVQVELGPFAIEIIGEGHDILDAGPSNLVYRGVKLAFEQAGKEALEVSIKCDNGIALGRGLGSSSAAVVSGLVAGNQMCGGPLSDSDLLTLATKEEGHPDNVAPALLGGCQIVVRDGERLVTSPVAAPNDLQAVLFIPETPMPTDEARSLLTPEVDRQDAVYNMGRVGLLVNAFTSGDYEHLAVATQDRLHQPARRGLFPPMKVIFNAAMDAGALGVFLSGAGSSILALTQGREMTIGYEMAEAASKAGVPGDIKITKPSIKGAQVVESR